MSDDLTPVELFLTQENLEQGTLTRPVPADEPDFHVVRYRGFGACKQSLPTIALVGIPDLNQHSHLRTRLLGPFSEKTYDTRKPANT